MDRLNITESGMSILASKGSTFHNSFVFTAAGVKWSAMASKCHPYFKYVITEPRDDKTNKMSVRPVKTQISLGIRPVWSESSLSAQWVAKGPKCLHADSEDSDQTGRMPRLIWVFAGRTLILLVFVISWLIYSGPTGSFAVIPNIHFHWKNC